VNSESLRVLLDAVASGTRSVNDALDAVRGFSDLGFARVDLDRARRRGLPEVVYGAGKTGAQIASILETLYRNQQCALATRVDAATAAQAMDALGDLPAEYDAEARCLFLLSGPVENRGLGTILVVSAGTSDRPVAAEAACVATLCGNRVERLDDVGVAGLHRLLSQVDQLRSASVVVVCAGMEGALPSVVAGLVDRPVIAVPTSVGYGVAMGGLTALMGMLTSCSSGVTVVNIDNGFGAAYAATLMNRLPS
jgi:NCAIR mutase (PurE)-related protein